MEQQNIGQLCCDGTCLLMCTWTTISSSAHQRHSHPDDEQGDVGSKAAVQGPQIQD
jgi:hypothetical protein